MKVASRKPKTAPKPTFTEARAILSNERERVVLDAQRNIMETQCFTDIVFYGLPFNVGENEPPTRKLGWRRPCDPTPAGCEDIARIPVAAISALNACRMLADRMENFPAFNCPALA